MAGTKRRRTNGHVTTKSLNAGRLALRKVNKLLRTREVKSVHGATTVTAHKVVNHMANIAQGETSSERDGDQVTAKHLEVDVTFECRASFSPGEQGAAHPVSFDVAVLVDKRQEVGQDPIFDSVWTGDALTGYFKDNDFKSRFRVLRKQRIVLWPTAENDASVNEEWAYTSKNIRWSIPLKQMLLNYVGANATGTIVGNGIYFSVDWGVVGTGPNILDYEAKTHYGFQLHFTDA